MLKRLLISMLVGLFGINVYADSHHPQQFLDSVAGKKNEGEEIVQHYCAVCHAEQPLIQLGAPRAGNSSDWGPRLKQGLQLLFQHSSEGYNAMPARGGCFECSDEQLMLAILALLPEKPASK